MANTMHSTWPLRRRLLCARLDSAGDVLMTTPALRALKKAELPCNPLDPCRVLVVAGP